MEVTRNKSNYPRGHAGHHALFSRDGGEELVLLPSPEPCGGKKKSRCPDPKEEKYVFRQQYSMKADIMCLEVFHIPPGNITGSNKRTLCLGRLQLGAPVQTLLLPPGFHLLSLYGSVAICYNNFFCTA